MKTIVTTICLIFTLVLNAQQTHLRFTNSKKNASISYAPNTKFEVKNKEGKILMSNENSSYQLKIKDEDCILFVYPSYKNGKDVYKLHKGAIVESVISEEVKTYISPNFYVNNYQVKGTKKITKSVKNPDKYNLEFRLSNGITFNYKDGIYTTFLNDKQLPVKGKYIIKSKLGILKVSFNPTNGETWWVFETK